MDPLDFSVAPTPALDPILNLYNVDPRYWDISLAMQGSAWEPPGAQYDSWTFSHSIPVNQQRSNLRRGTPLSHPSRYSETVDPVHLDVVSGPNDHFCTFFALGPSFDNNAPLPSLAPELGGARYICSGPENCWCLVLTDALLTDALAMGSIEDSNHEIAGYSSPSTTATTLRIAHPSPQLSYLGQNTEKGIEISGFDGIPPMDVPRQYSKSTEPATILNENSPLNLAAWIDRPSDLGEITEMIGFEQLLGEGSVSYCEWTDEDGTVCRNELTRASLPGHLSTHGIKSMSRDRPTKCKWAGCTRKKSINRESIVRHIREVHLHLKRPPKRVQELRP